MRRAPFRCRLRDLPFADLKLDRCFVWNCAVGAINAGLCKTVDVAHRFDSVAVAKGIEVASDLQALRQMGCDIGQGFLLAGVMPKERLVSLLRGTGGKLIAG